MRHKLSLAVLIFIWLCSAHVRTSAQTKLTIEDGRRAEKVDSYIREKMSARHIPGLSLAVVRNGKIIYAKGYGMANLELSVPASPETNYPIYSVTKIFTATAVMMLVEEGKLALEDPIYKHLTGISPVGKSITVRQLLSHTSGITKYADRPYVASEEVYDGTLADYEKWVANFTLASPPGERWAYIDTGYFLLGRLIEKVSGKTYEQFLRERIFAPLEMNDTRVESHVDLIPNRASGYSWRNGSFRKTMRKYPETEFAFGGLVSTVLDMAKWDAALNTEKLLKRATWEQMWTNAKLNNGQTVASYGLGFGVTPFRGHKRVGHTGGGPGFVAAYTRFVDDKIAVILLANADQDEIKIGEMANEIASLYFTQ